MGILDQLFSGIYAYFLRSDNRGKFELSSYFALTSLIALVGLEILAIFSITIILGEPFLTLGITYYWSGFIVIGVLFFLNWLLFVKGDRYKHVVKRYLTVESNRGSKQLRIANAIIVIDFVVFAAAMVFAAFR
jgi:hypothetical protein